MTTDWCRKSSVQKRKLEQFRFQQDEIQLFADTSDPDLAEFRQHISAALLNLPEAQQTAVHLKLIGGFTFEEIASIEGVSPNTAVSRYRYGLAKLQSALRPIYNEIANP